MTTWVLYDIGDDRARHKVAKYCKQAGLYRVQLSVFLGNLEPTARDTLALQLEALIDPTKDKVYIFVMNRPEMQQAQLLGQAFDKKLVTDAIRAMFF